MPEAQLTYEQLDLIRRIARLLATEVDIYHTLQSVVQWLAESCHMERGVIALLSENEEEVQGHITADAIPAARSDRMRYRPGEGITGRVFATGEPVYLPQLAEENQFLDRSGIRKGLDLSKLAFFCVPVTYQDHIIGTLSVDKNRSAVEDPAGDMAFLNEIAQLLAPFVQRRRLERQMDLYHRAKQFDGAFARLIGRSTAMSEVQKLIAKVADTNTTVLITGETGTGKGVAAEVIHQLSPRTQEPFVEVNCGAIPEALVESELFGHEKGAFTGASQKRTGVLERAGSGTVLLDEVGELPLAAQTKLLRVLQKREFERVGGGKTLACNARIIAATNRDLSTAIVDGQFRSDLFYRLNVFPIHMPPLRERGKADIMLLVDHFTQYMAEKSGKDILRIDTPAIDMLTAYHWPGNVREVENVLERAVLLADGGVIHGHHLPPSLQMNRYAESQENLGSFDALVRNYEVELITDALKDTNGNQTKAAEQLGITKRIIQYKIHKYGIDYRRFR
ncbi:MAG: sigma 54-interacting transcriptional regulator [Candidatus Pacebacteria bacterium]|nr:sigma 54-interacting transcriptional regulator [Candidatus Paceibacterota bacterium]